VRRRAVRLICALAPQVIEHDVGQGDELAVAVAVAVDPSEDVPEFLLAEAVPAAVISWRRSYLPRD
jgi:hypothetical protein